MRQLTQALSHARDGTGHIRAILVSAAFKPRLPGLTKIVSKLSKEGAWRKSLEVFEAVDDLGIVPDTALTNAAISACDKGGRWQKALEIFDRMDMLGLSRDAITYSAMISSLAKGKQWQFALNIFEHMQNAGVAADVVTCCSLINALERGGRWDLAEKLFLQMCSGNHDSLARFAVDAGLCGDDESNVHDGMHKTLNPNSVGISHLGGVPDGHSITLFRSKTLPVPLQRADGSASHSGFTMLTAVAPAAAENGRLPSVDKCDGSFSHGTHRNISQPHSASISAPKTAVEELSSAFAHAVAFKEDSMVDEAAATPWRNAHITGQMTPGQTLHAAHSLISACSSLPSTSSVSSFAVASLPGSINHQANQQGLEGLQNSNTNACYTTIATNNNTQNLGRNSTIDAAAAHLHRAMSCFPEFNDATLHRLSGSHVARDQISFDFGHAAGITPNRICCNALLAAYARAKPSQWQRALGLIQAMWTGGPLLTPDVVSYNTAIKACTASSQLSHALDVYHEMIKHSVQPNSTTYNSIITSAADTGNLHTLHNVGEWLSHAPYDVLSACMNVYVTALASVGAWNDAVQAFKDMLLPQSPCHPSASTFNLVLSFLVRHGDASSVEWLLEEMQSCGVAPSILTFNTMIEGCAESGAWREAMRALSMIDRHYNGGSARGGHCEDGMIHPTAATCQY